jgi:hypothetical protein
MKQQALREERVYHIEAECERGPQGLKLCDAQVREAKSRIAAIFGGL